VSVYEVDPIQDRRWADLLERHPRASVFASTEWLKALRQTYGFDPRVLTTSPPGSEMRNGLPICRVKGWLAGHRLVALPFSDHCEPLMDRPEELFEIMSFLEQQVSDGNWKYVELRPRNPFPSSEAGSRGFRDSRSYYFHKLDLSARLEDLFRGFNKKSIQKRIERAGREGLTHEAGRSDSLLAKFYDLLVLTRRRHGLPPQPLTWFRNLIESMGDRLRIRVASKDGRAVASVLTLSYKKSIVYKYGCSDARYHNLGGMPFLLWQTIEEAKKMDLEELDLGRSDTENSGLAEFKSHLGARCSTLTYYRCPASRAALAGSNNWKMRTIKRVFYHTPDRLLTAAGRLLYKHLG
jgi:CelD/BcsL family acetyltransferase involved in cellulose biosynthesis